jgi:hypothetical protein
MPNDMPPTRRRHAEDHPTHRTTQLHRPGTTHSPNSCWASPRASRNPTRARTDCTAASPHLPSSGSAPCPCTSRARPRARLAASLSLRWTGQTRHAGAAPARNSSTSTECRSGRQPPSTARPARPSWSLGRVTSERATLTAPQIQEPAPTPPRVPGTPRLHRHYHASAPSHVPTEPRTEDPQVSRASTAPRADRSG